MFPFGPMPHSPYAGQAKQGPRTAKPPMKRVPDWDVLQIRETIRQAAYELARSGVCDGWQDVWRALRARFTVAQLTTIFENPLCRLDVDQRCYCARNPGKDDSALTARLPVIRRDMCEKNGTSIPTAVHRQPQRAGRLAGQIRALLADGSERTAMQIAQQLGTSRNEVLVAVRAMLADGALQVTRHVCASHRGRGARVFACAGTAARKKHDEGGLYAPWPQADPVVTTAIDAIARHR
jgi:hypothetical protein